MTHATAPLAIGTKAHNFALLDTISGRLFTLNDIASPKATVIMFICNHCPYVKHILEGIVEVAKAYIPKGVSFVAISSNNANAYPQDGPTAMKALAKDLNFPFPYLYDQTQQVARTFQAVCTPEFFVYDKSMRLAYHGQFDDSRPNNSLPVTGSDLKMALDLLLSNKPAQDEQLQSVGCSIKWHPQE
jgi:thiol-disulfide isomerase/thioredoxin